jgi:hypothetical protein
MFVRKKQVTGEPGSGQEILVCDITFNVLFLFLLPAATEVEVQILLSTSRPVSWGPVCHGIQHNPLLNNTQVGLPSGKSCLAQVPYLLRKTKVHYRARKRSQLFPILSKMNPIHALMPCVIKVRFNIILPYKFMPPKRYVLFKIYK